MNNFKENLNLFLNSIEKFLLYKNEKYGNSALDPIKIFNKNDKSQLITARIDDKLNRIKNSEEIKKNDCIDLLGYLVLLSISKDWLDITDIYE